MSRRWRGVLCIEGVQTGDGRLVAEGALTWPDLPLPLGWLQEEQHGDLLSGAVQVGTIDSITREGNDVVGEGTIDDEQPDGAELVRRLDAGTASLGNRVGLSIDPDDWEYEVVATDQQEEGILLLASGTGALPPPLATMGAVRAAAGDPDPGEDGTVVYADSADSYIQRYTRLRIRGVTACAIAAFDGCYLELADAAAAEADDTGDGTEAEPAAVAAAASAPARLAPVTPPAEWFTMPEPTPDMRGMVDVYGMPVEELLVEQPDGRLGVPLTVTDDGRVFGHSALWGQCHVGYPGECVTPPESASAYAHYHTGQVVCADGTRVATGVLTVGCDHALAHLRAPEAQDHYAHAGVGWADVRASNGELGVWNCGALRPDVTAEQLRVIRALALSGDWRRIGVGLEYIASLAVNVAGFPIAREAVLASALPDLHAALPAAHLHTEAGEQVSLVAAGMVTRCSECQRRASMEAGGVDLGTRLLEATPDPRVDEVLAMLRVLDLRTRHLAPEAAEAARRRLRNGGGGGGASGGMVLGQGGAGGR